jgi:DNA-directed RNA polymerase subunit RPC12/RpoP
MNQKKQHKFSVEQLFHFNCGECKKWWSIGDFHLLKQDEISCPHCGYKTDFKQIEDEK